MWDLDLDINRWNVYAYIYPKHPLFDKFKGNSFWQDATILFPFHCGVSFLKYHYKDNCVTSIQVGSDYNHDGDNYYSHLNNTNEDSSIFEDAKKLFIQKYGATDEEMKRLLGDWIADSDGKIGEEDILVNLKGLLNALRDGAMTVEDMFSRGSAETFPDTPNELPKETPATDAA